MGNHETVTVTNVSAQPVGAVLILGLVDMTPGQPAPLDLETWTGDPASVEVPVLSPGASASWAGSAVGPPIWHWASPGSSAAAPKEMMANELDSASRSEYPV